MSKYKNFKPLSLERIPRNVLNANKERLATYKRNKKALLTRLTPLNCLPSFLIRTMHDYLSSEAKLSAYQKYVINAWERAGLDKGDAHKVISRLYGIGDTLFQKLDKSYLSGGTEKLDKRLRKDIAKIDWNKYFSHEKVLSPTRIQRAIETKSLAGVTKKEKAFLNNLAKAYKKRNWGSFMRDKKTTGIASRLIAKKKGQYIIRLGPRADAEHFQHLDTLNERLREVIRSEPREPEPELKLCSYEWSLERVGHRIVKYEEATGDDPVFIYTCFLYTGIEHPRKVSDTEVYKPAEHEKHNRWRTSAKDIYPTYGVHCSEVPERPLLVVTAIEDDQYLSSDTAAYLDFGLDVADKVAALDPTGISSIVVTIMNIALGIVMFFDWLDEDEVIGTTAWEMPLEYLLKPPEGENVTQPYSFWPVLGFEGEGSHWELMIKTNIHSAVFS